MSCCQAKDFATTICLVFMLIDLFHSYSETCLNLVYRDYYLHRSTIYPLFKRFTRELAVKHFFVICKINTSKWEGTNERFLQRSGKLDFTYCGNFQQPQYNVWPLHFKRPPHFKLCNLKCGPLKCSYRAI